MYSIQIRLCLPMQMRTKWLPGPISDDVNVWELPHLQEPTSPVMAACTSAVERMTNDDGSGGLESEPLLEGIRGFVSAATMASRAGSRESRVAPARRPRRARAARARGGCCMVHVLQHIAHDKNH